MSGKICISKRLLIILFSISIFAIGTVYFSNFLIRKPTTVRTRAEEIKSTSSIMYGNLANENQFPYFSLISIKKNGHTYGCGGTLIGDEYILTAAHCVYGALVNDIYVIGGLNHIDSNLKGHFTSEVTEIIIKDDFNYSLVPISFFIELNDIAILRLKKKAVGIPTLSIPDPSVDRNGDGKIDLNDYPEKIYSGKQYSGLIIGFGSTEKEIYSNDLRMGSMYIEDYAGRLKDKVKLNSEQKIQFCEGDSGGAFIMILNNKP